MKKISILFLAMILCFISNVSCAEVQQELYWVTLSDESAGGIPKMLGNSFSSTDEVLANDEVSLYFAIMTIRQVIKETSFNFRLEYVNDPVIYVAKISKNVLLIYAMQDNDDSFRLISIEANDNCIRIYREFNKRDSLVDSFKKDNFRYLSFTIEDVRKLNDIYKLIDLNDLNGYTDLLNKRNL